MQFSLKMLLFVIAITSTAAYGNAKIVFVSSRDGNNELYVMNRDGSGQTRLTHTTEDEFSPAGSPDGRTIAFWGKTSGIYSIKLMNRDGTNVRTILGTEGCDPPISWSPDGTRIAFTKNHRIHTIRTDGSGVVVLSPDQVADYEPSWSPDGQSIAFTRHSLTPGPNGIFRMRSDGGGAVPVALHDFLYAGFSGPTWSPDGQRIAFTYPGQGDLAGNDSIGYVENGPIIPIIQSQGGTPYRDGPKYSPDGQDLVYYQSFPGTPYYNVYQITTLYADLTDLTSSNFSPDWLPMRAGIDISGRITSPSGNGLRNISVTLSDEAGIRRTATTGSFGLFAFDDIAPGLQYTVSVGSKRYRFQARTVTPSSNITGFDFIGLE